MSTTGDFRKLVRKARRRGWKLVETNPHFILEWVDGRRVTAARTPSDYRGVLNFLADLKRIERTPIDNEKT